MKHLLYCWLATLITVSLALAACRVSSPAVTAPGAESSPTPAIQNVSATQTAVETAPQTAPILATPTFTPLPPLAVLLAPPGSDTELADRLFAGLQPALEQAGLRWETRQALEPASLSADLRLVVAIPPDPDLVDLAAAAPQVQFLAVGYLSVKPSVNLSLLGSLEERPDQQGFIAGVIAAIITPDWRVGVLGPGDTPATRAARQGFLNGAIYFCGLCLPYHGPSVDYPVYVELPAGAGAQDIQAAMQGLKNLAVKTVYVVPGSLNSDLASALAQAGLKVVGGGAPPPELAQTWVATVQADPLPAMLELLPTLLAGQGGQTLPMGLILTHTNPALFSPGRQERVQEILADLLAGYIDTGVDPLSGETR